MLALVYFLGNTLLQQLWCKCKNSCISVSVRMGECVFSFMKAQRTLAVTAFIIFFIHVCLFFFLLKFYFFSKFFLFKNSKLFCCYYFEFEFNHTHDSMSTIGNSFVELKKVERNSKYKERNISYGIVCEKKHSIQHLNHVSSEVYSIYCFCFCFHRLF